VIERLLLGLLMALVAALGVFTDEGGEDDDC